MIALIICLAVVLVTCGIYNFTIHRGTIASGHANKAAAIEAEELFATKFKKFTHAAKIGDRTGFANGRFKLNYPRLAVGEIMVDITGFTVEGEDMLALPDGTKIQLFSVSESSKRTRF